MMLSISSVFTIQTDKDEMADIVAIETLITKGIYRFTLLGMPTKTASDAKDRVYSALRASGLLNLKSDNRKIIVNMTPENTLKKDGFYDLGIAISCISCIDTDIPNEKILALGGLSISGLITPSHRLKQAIYTAHIHDIKTIVCSNTDRESLDLDSLQALAHHGITIISAETLKEVIYAFKNTFSDRFKAARNTNYENIKTIQTKKGTVTSIDLETLDPVVRAIFIGLCGGHHILIQSPLTTAIKQISSTMCSYIPEKRFGREIYTAYKDKLLDQESGIDVLYIENIKNYAKQYIQSNQLSHKESIVGIYTPCTCGYQYAFFEEHAREKRCICSQRTILQHKRTIESTYFDLFSMHFSNTDNTKSNSTSVEITKESIQILHATIHTVRNIQFNRYIRINSLPEQEIFLFPDNTYLNEYCNIEGLLQNIDIDADALKTFQTTKNSKALTVARTIQDIFDMNIDNITKKQSPISKKALLLAISYIPRMDF